MKIYFYLSNIIHNKRLDADHSLFQIYCFTDETFAKYNLKKLAGLSTEEFFTEDNYLELFLPTGSESKFKNLNTVCAFEINENSFKPFSSAEINKTSSIEETLVKTGFEDFDEKNFIHDIIESEKDRMNSLIIDPNDKADLKRIFEKYGI